MTRETETQTAAKSVTEVLAIALLVFAFLSVQALIGGTRLIFAIPAYSLIGVAGFLTIFSWRSAKPNPNQLALFSTVVFFGYIEVRALFSATPYLAESDLYSVLAGLVVYFSTACIFTSSKARMWVVAVLLVAALAQVLAAAAQFRNGDNFMPIRGLERFDYGSRGSGFYICPNHLAGLLEVLGIFGMSIVCWSRWPVWGKLLVGYATIACYVGVILTGSRGGYLSVAASFALFGVVSFSLLRSAGAKILLRLGGAGAIIAAILLASAVLVISHSRDLSDRATNVVDKENMRLDLWKAAIEQWKVSPIFGTGAGTYVIYGRMFRTERMQLDPIYTHNDYLQLLAEYGLIGAALLALFLIVHIRNGFRHFARLGPRRIAASGQMPSNALALNVGGLCAVAAYIVHSVFDFNLHIPANLLVMAFVFGILANADTVRARNGMAQPVSMRWRWLPAVLALILGWQCFHLAPGAYFAERARVALRDYRLIEAVSQGISGIAAAPKNPELFFTLGRARVLLAESMDDPRARDSFYRAALDDFLKARSLAPSDETFAIESGLTFDALRRFEEAEWMFFEARRLDPKSLATAGYYQSHLMRWKTGGANSGDSTKTDAPRVYARY